MSASLRSCSSRVIVTALLCATQVVFAQSASYVAKTLQARPITETMPMPVLRPFQQDSQRFPTRFQPLPHKPPFYFDRVVAIGDFDLTLMTGQNGEVVDVMRGRGTQATASQVHSWVQGGTLYLCNGAHCTARSACSPAPAPAAASQVSQLPHVVVHMGAIKQLTYAGNGHLQAADIVSPHLRVFVDNTQAATLSGAHLRLRIVDKYGQGDLLVQGLETKQLAVANHGAGRVRLRGVANLSQLTYSGRGVVDAHWLHSCHLRVLGYGQAKAVLAGVADDLRVTLRDHATLDGRYLRTNAATVRTQDQAQARVYPRHSLFALAADQSHIAYYRRPDVVSPYMTGQGTVLDYTNLAKGVCSPDVPLYRVGCALRPVKGLG